MGKNISTIFKRISSLNSKKIAIYSDHKNMLFSELDSESDRYAAQIIESIPSDIICVDLADSLDRIVVFLAIAKSGKIYWPINENTPSKRIKDNSVQCGCEALISDNIDKYKFFKFRINISLLKKYQQHFHVEFPKIHEDSPLYINFSSGTTGSPKGILIPHRGVIRLCQSIDELISPTNILHYSTIEFDASTFEIWASILNGKACIAIDTSKSFNLRIIKSYIRKYKVNCIWMTSALFNSFIDVDPEFLSSVSNLIIGGDVVSKKHVLKLYDFNTEICAFNGYGPTENTTFTTIYKIPRLTDKMPNLTVPIGTPISKTNLYILDENMNVVKNGEIGNLFIGGDGLTLGYFENGNIVSPLKLMDINNHKIHLYHSGDMVFRNRFGDLEFAGRMDEQMKINGIRIDPYEINNLVSSIPKVMDCASIYVGKNSHKKKLISFIKVNERINKNLILNILEENIPKYMIPSEFIFVDDIPYNKNGKIDKIKLISLIDRTFTCAQQFEDKLSKILFLCWKETLYHFDINKNFFDNGGDSLKAVVLSSLVEEKLELELPFSKIYEYSNFYTMRDYLDKSHPSNTKELARIIHLDELSFNLSSQQERYFLSYLSTSTLSTSIISSDNLYIYGDISKKITRKSIIQSLKKIIKRHKILNTKLIIENDKIKQLRNDNYDFPIRYSSTSKNNFKFLINGESKIPFKIFKDKLFRCYINVTEISSYPIQYAFVINHILVDAKSLDIIKYDLESFIHNQYISDIPFDYFDYSFYNKKNKDEKLYISSKYYWINYFKKNGINSLPIIKNIKSRGYRVKRKINKLAFQNIEKVANKRSISPASIFISLFMISIKKTLSIEALTIGVPISCRTSQELNKVCGFFVDMIPMTIKISKKNYYLDFSEKINLVLTKSIDNKLFQFQDIVKTLGYSYNKSKFPITGSFVNVVKFEKSFNDYNLNEFDEKNIEFLTELPRYDLNLYIKIFKDSLIVDLSFDERILPKSKAVEFIGDISTNIMEVIK